MDDTAVVAGLVGRYFTLFFEDDDFEARMLPEKLEGNGEADDSSPDYGNITIPTIAILHLL